jgi:3-isopropylmalate/(R)-2-methylmalate dehydratase small subunit
MKLKGLIHKYGDNINTDVIIPARYCNTVDQHQLALHCLEDLDADFIKKVRSGDIIAAGNNFGCGSSREVAPMAIKTAGISCVIAKSFARIFYRNSINIGLPIFECPGLIDDIATGEMVEVRPGQGTIYRCQTGTLYQFVPENDVIREIIAKGGLVNYTRMRLTGSNSP